MRFFGRRILSAAVEGEKLRSGVFRLHPEAAGLLSVELIPNAAHCHSPS